MEKLRIAVDMDEVIADTLGYHLDCYNREFECDICKDDLRDKWLWQVIPHEHRERMETILRAPGFFGELPIFDDAQRVLQAMHDEYEIFIASAAMEVPTSFAAKFQWMEQHFPFIPPSHLVFCGDKAILNADFLIDDNARHFRRFRGEGVLFDAPHNASVSGYKRVHSWLEVEEMFLGENRPKR